MNAVGESRPPDREAVHEPGLERRGGGLPDHRRRSTAKFHLCQPGSATKDDPSISIPRAEHATDVLPIHRDSVEVHVDNSEDDDDPRRPSRSRPATA